MTVKLFNLRNSAYTCQYTGISHQSTIPEAIKPELGCCNTWLASV